MIKKIKKKLIKKIDSRFEAIKENQSTLQQKTFNYNQISKLFAEESFIPFTAWAISPTTILHVLNEIVINKRKAIIEFGAGASTFYIAKLIKVLQLETVFYTIESDVDWANEMQRQLKLLGLEEHVIVVHSPIAEASSTLTYKQQESWYDVRILEKRLNSLKIRFDLVLVDGPVGTTTSYARYSAIPFLRDKMTKNCVIFLDDVDREDEKKIIAEWKKMTNSRITFIERYAILSKQSNFDVSPFRI